MAAAIGEFVSEGDPFALNQNLKAFDRSIVRIEHQFGQGGDLRRSVPAVGAMNQDGSRLFIDRRHDEGRRADQGRQIVQPSRRFQLR